MQLYFERKDNVLNFAAMENYFLLYGLPLSFHPDPEKVKKKYYELSRKFHPDRFAQAGPEAMDEALQLSSLNNQAYNTFKDPYATMQYILKFHGVLEDEEKYDLPPDFLLEMMELNEAVSEYEIDPTEDNRELAINNWQSLTEEMGLEIKKLTDRYDAGEQSPALLSAIKDFYFRKKYLLRIQERIAKFATP